MTTKKTKPKKTTPEAEANAQVITSYDDFAERLKLRLTVAQVDKNPNVPNWDADHWKVTLARGKKKLVTYYSKTFGHQGEKPTLEEVLCCISIDARILEKSKTYEEWLTEYSWTDAPHSKHIYADAKRVSNALKGLLGPDEFKTLLSFDAIEEKKS